MKTFSSLLKQLTAALVSIVLLAVFMMFVMVMVMLGLKAIIPFTGFAAVALLLVASWAILQVAFSESVLGKIADVVLTMVYYAFGENYEMRDADDVQTVTVPRAAPDPAAA